MVEDSSQSDNANSMVVELAESTNSKVETVNKSNFFEVEEDCSERLWEHVVLEGCNDLFSNDKSTKIVGKTVEDPLEEKKHDLVVDSDNPVFPKETTSAKKSVTVLNFNFWRNLGNHHKILSFHFRNILNVKRKSSVSQVINI